MKATVTSGSAPQSASDERTSEVPSIPDNQRFNAGLTEGEPRRPVARLRLQQFEEDAPVAIHLIGLDGVLLGVNRAELELLGYIAHEYVGHHVADFHVDVAAIDDILRRIRAGEEFRDCEARLRCKNGSTKHVLVSSNALVEGGNLVGYRCFTRDISDRKHAEEALRRQIDLFATLVEHIPDIVSRLDRDLRYIYTSPAVAKITGRPAHEYIGKPRTNTGVPPEFAQLREDLSRKVLETGREQSLEFPIYTPGGERLLECRLIPEFRPDGSVESLMTLTRDVTERKRAEEALRQSEERWRFMAESMPQKIFTATSAGEMDYFNRRWAEFTGLSFAELKKNWGRFVHPDELEETIRLWRQSVETGQPFEFVHRLQCADVSYRWHLTRAHPMLDISGKISMWIGSSTDIHEAKESEANLRRVNEDLSQFAFAASHDFQEPLRMIAIYSELLLKRYSGNLDAKAATYVHFIVDGIKRMRELLADLLSFTEAGADSEKACESIDLNVVLQMATQNLQTAIEETSAIVTSDHLPSVQCQQAHFIQLFQNLISNAIKYRSSRPPRIHFSAEKRHTEWLMTVTDNGMGIAPEYHQRIFGVFRRLHGKEIPGSGMGLAICQRVIERYGGRIWLESTVDHGSTFFFTLPLVGGGGSSESPTKPT